LADHKDTLEFELGATLKSGLHVPINVTLEYPEDCGLHAVRALEQLVTTQINTLYQELVSRQDGSIVQALLQSGHAYEEDEFD
jgi:hypothetical protein